MKTQKSRVIFLWRHNAVTSQMSEGFLRHYSGDRFEVFSAEQKGAA
jgi:protein-tyrosine-phosphatase